MAQPIRPTLSGRQAARTSSAPYTIIKRNPPPKIITLPTTVVQNKTMSDVTIVYKPSTPKAVPPQTTSAASTTPTSSTIKTTNSSANKSSNQGAPTPTSTILFKVPPRRNQGDSGQNPTEQQNMPQNGTTSSTSVAPVPQAVPSQVYYVGEGRDGGGQFYFFNKIERFRGFRRHGAEGTDQHFGSVKFLQECADLHHAQDHIFSLTVVTRVPFKFMYNDLVMTTIGVIRTEVHGGYDSEPPLNPQLQAIRDEQQAMSKKLDEVASSLQDVAEIVPQLRQLGAGNDASSEGDGMPEPQEPTWIVPKDEVKALKKHAFSETSFANVFLKRILGEFLPLLGISAVPAEFMDEAFTVFCYFYNRTTLNAKQQAKTLVTNELNKIRSIYRNRIRRHRSGAYGKASKKYFYYQLDANKVWKCYLDHDYETPADLYMLREEHNIELPSIEAEEIFITLKGPNDASYFNYYYNYTTNSELIFD